MYRKIQEHTLIQLSFVVAATIVAGTAVLYANLINSILGNYFDLFTSHPYLMSLATPVLFIFATFLVVKFGPDAKGSGIPQVLEALRYLNENKDTRQLVSVKTALVKILSSLVGLLGGASIGREGPTVQIAASIFSLMSKKMKDWYNVQIKPQSYLIAGAAAGVAAAFNTPLAGITFALEEITDGAFSQFKRPVMFSIIVAGIAAQAFLGNYLYFGHPVTIKPTQIIFIESLIIGAVCGILGGVFARILAQKDFKLTGSNWILKSLLAGIVCAALAYFSNAETSGSGYEVIKNFMDGTKNEIPTFFWIQKILSTAFSYFSGMAGGIFSPTLSIGAGIGYSISILLHFINIKTCALIGMVAFFSGVVQAPLTAVVIVMEMTDEHSLIIPFMIAAVIAQVIGKLFMPTPLYHYLAFGEKKTEN